VDDLGVARRDALTDTRTRFDDDHSKACGGECIATSESDDAGADDQYVCIFGGVEGCIRGDHAPDCR
jgi:hypothetical protein